MTNYTESKLDVFLKESKTHSLSKPDYNVSNSDKTFQIFIFKSLESRVETVYYLKLLD